MKVTKLYILGLVAVMSGACQKDLLKPTPQSYIPDYLGFETKDRIANQARGLYAVLKDGRFLGGKVEIANDVRGEDFFNEGSNSVTFNLSWRMLPTGEAQEVQEIWTQGYKTINNANVFMEAMKATGNKVVGDELAKQYEGEAKFVRALSYFSLLQLYARPYWDGDGSKLGLILYTEGHTLLGDYAKARSTVKETYALILKDLDDAEAALPKENAGSVNAVTRANAYTVAALKTRVYLHLKQYDKVIASAAKLVSVNAPFTSPGGHKLEPEVNKIFARPYTTNESIFSLPFSAGPGDAPATQTQLGYYYAFDKGNGEYSLDEDGILADSGWKSGTDARRKLLEVVPQGAGVQPKYFLNKYAAGSPFTDWAPIIRYAEVLLNLAEARVRQTNSVDPQAVALLSAVRNRSDATITYTAADFTSSAKLLEAILHEKRIELLGEGFRSSEITRLGITFPGKGGGIVPSVLPASPKYIWPIASSELVYNKLCVDNN
ncbi:RagB/SusD family nutrient uptake outer membrane protein [Chitinophaga nivalis]|uniref:RagB/SusD family nutrient uptake outer membrane protein n=1 Tax=Chitinophaga nivalis TaxID=2991709 RepID=A0ABT3ISB7_9BACT|nr:RagB/SusD family nutrient uptake outer membrane protein [Chitinophaga nivalis]MCW3463428.1 RagB/SusD family nutrient uptake outer membrane protein [Chitinophaga nivalis]MCW3486882.1 RagB/SusD family nutrient uptake outer membrane protein [Chitinophaga nivalis]